MTGTVYEVQCWVGGVWGQHHLWPSREDATYAFLANAQRCVAYFEREGLPLRIVDEDGRVVA
jgi:hypothetical protein